MKAFRNFFVSKKTRNQFRDVHSGVAAAKLEREKIENEIAPEVKRQVVRAHQVLAHNHFAETLSRTFVKRSPNGGLIQ